MKATARKRQRIARVRNIQHNRAAAEASKAEQHAQMLQLNADRLASLRLTLTAETGNYSASDLSSRAELAMRLDQARHGLTDAIASANANAQHFSALRLDARQKQESADKLHARAQQALEEYLERAAMVTRVARKRFISGDEI